MVASVRDAVRSQLNCAARTGLRRRNSPAYVESRRRVRLPTPAPHHHRAPHNRPHRRRLRAPTMRSTQRPARRNSSPRVPAAQSLRSATERQQHALAIERREQIVVNESQLNDAHAGGQVPTGEPRRYDERKIGTPASNPRHRGEQRRNPCAAPRLRRRARTVSMRPRRTLPAPALAADRRRAESARCAAPQSPARAPTRLARNENR